MSLALSFALFAVALAAVTVASVHVAAVRTGVAAPDRWRWTMSAAALTALWMTATWYAAASGALADFDRRPPGLVLLVIAILTASVAIAFSPVGRLLASGLPLAWLVGLQGFRFPLELLMHRAYTDGVMPGQMSYSGQNVDIVSGVTAVIVAVLLVSGAPRWLASIWNLLGAVLLVNIIVIALRSTPLIAAYGPDRLNVWVTRPPFVWLPAVMVLVAVTGHLVIARAVFASRSGIMGTGHVSGSAGSRRR